MKLILVLGFALLISACFPFSMVRTERLVKVPVEPEIKNEPEDAMVSVAQLLTVRQILCRLPEDEQANRLQLYRQVFVEKEVDESTLRRETGTAVPSEVHLLYALMLATCDPQRTPGVVSEMLSEVDAVGKWPEEHEALIDLLMAEQNAYLVLNNRYEELLEQHEKTIQGIKNIEAEIDKADSPNL